MNKVVLELRAYGRVRNTAGTEYPILQSLLRMVFKNFRRNIPRNYSRANSGRYSLLLVFAVFVQIEFVPQVAHGRDTYATSNISPYMTWKRVK